LFAALAQAGTPISPPGFSDGASEVYPGHLWKILAGPGLPKKGTVEGRVRRKRILESLGISGLPDLPTHDENDACVAAVLAAAADGAVPGMTLKGVGVPLISDPDGTLREGLIVVPQMDDRIRGLISGALKKTGSIVVGPTDVEATALLLSSTPDNVAEDLLGWFIALASEGKPKICTFSWAYRKLFNASYGKWSQAYTRQVIDVAKRTQVKELKGLGDVRLDTFIVAKSNGKPGDGHWQGVQYEREAWLRILGTAAVLQ
jgi:hypothetical protein